VLGHREMALDDYLGILRRRWLLIAVLAVVGVAGGYGVAHFLPKRYTSQTLVLVQHSAVPIDYVKPVVSDATNGRLASMQQEILSRSRLEPIIQQLGLYREDINVVAMEDLVGRLRQTITVTPVEAMAQTTAEGLPGFTVSVNFGDPRLAQQICSSVTSLFIEEDLQLRQREAEQTTQFLAKQLDDAKGKLDEQDAKLAEFQRRYLGSLPEDEKTNLDILSGLSSQLDAATQTLARAQQDKTFAESALDQQQSAFRASQEGRNPETSGQELAALQAQLATLRSKYTDNYPDVVKAMNDIEILKARIATSEPAKTTPDPGAASKPVAEPAQIQSLRAQINQFDEVIKDRTAQQEQIQKRITLYQTRVEGSPAVEQEYKQLTRDYQTALEFYNDLLKKRDQSAMATDLERRQQGEQFQILDPANLPDNPSFPKKGIFALGGLGGGLALGLGLTLLLEMQDTSFRNEKDVEALLHLPVLAMVPKLHLAQMEGLPISAMRTKSS
jgi:polysaccharide chain length determinant protein (PEP-CTERM system associated)